MVETSRRRKAVTSSFYELSTDQLGDRVVMRGWGEAFFLQQAYGLVLKDDVKGFSFTSDICLMGVGKKIKERG
jgi:hypothetical protein